MTKTPVVRAAAGIVAAAGLWLAWSQVARQPLTMEKVTDGLWVIIGNGGNVAVMPTSEGVLLVDDKFDQDGPEIRAKVKSITDQPIKYIVNTHQHGDHTGGNKAFLEGSAEIIAHKNARANMVSQKMPGLPRITFSDETQIFLGGKEVRVQYFGRGHTSGDVMVFFPSERIVHTGDLFVRGAPFIDYSSGGSLTAWDQTLAAALKADFDTVIPGHGAVSKRADLAQWRVTLATLRTRAKAACAQGTDGMVGRMKLEELGMKPSPLFERSAPGLCEETKN
ncbi:MAG: MBL fold metallo-hydrolase [Acidobacteria bacterium]|nr:MBL fold metallo-hydrolase [Acidobacteriota bacterium]